MNTRKKRESQKYQDKKATTIQTLPGAGAVNSWAGPESLCLVYKSPKRLWTARCNVFKANAVMLVHASL